MRKKKKTSERNFATLGKFQGRGKRQDSGSYISYDVILYVFERKKRMRLFKTLLYLPRYFQRTVMARDLFRIGVYPRKINGLSRDKYRGGGKRAEAKYSSLPSNLFSTSILEWNTNTRLFDSFPRLAIAK